MRVVEGTLIIAIGAVAITNSAFSQAAYKPQWQKVEADNGAVYQIDLNSISHFSNGTAESVVYAVEGPGYNPENMRRLWFDCQGKYRDSTGPGIGPTSYAPPRSIIGRISQIACAGAKETRFQDSSSPQPKPTPAQYCVGFSPASCARITAAVEAKPKPDYCRPGFGLVGSGLSSEQLRICYVISSEEVRTRNESSSRMSGDEPPARSYNITLTATKGEFPIIIGRTDLPDGTKLLVSITKPRLPNARELLSSGRPMCEDDCLPAAGPKGEVLGVATTALAGAFSAGPFSWAGKPFRPGTFEVEIFLVSLPGEQPRSPQDYEKQMDRMKKPVLTSSVVVSP
ncbi:MAG: hypothetical protein OJF48_003138 [Afipia sp.]|nr:MAG: hypothetical protein OJF48_003138 [Afipia sp.]